MRRTLLVCGGFIAACSGGASIDTSTPPIGIAVDRDHVYWVEASSGVHRASLDGGDASVLAHPAGGSWYALALDTTTVYGAVDSGVYATPKAGGTSRLLAPAEGNRSMYAAVDGDTVYFTDISPSVGTSRVVSVPKTGGAISVLARAACSLTGIAADGTYVYFTVDVVCALTPMPDLINNAGLYRVNKAGGTAEQLGSGLGYAVVVDDSYVYWAPEGVGIMRITKADRSSTSLASAGPTHQFGHLALDDTRVYWTVINDGEVRSVLKEGGGERQHLSGLNVPTHVAVNADWIYAAELGTPRSCPGSSCPTDGFGIERTHK